MNNAIRQHIPDFCEGFDKATVEFDTLEELLAIPFVKNFSRHPTFFRFSMSDRHLIAEYRGGREWWVVGTLSHPEAVPLPDWDHGWYEVWIDGRADLVAGYLVKSSCGDEVRLRDGRVVKRREP
jgi:hypothetical protein